MKKMRFWLIVSLLLLTGGCASQEGESHHQEALNARSTYLNLREGEGTARILSDYGQRVYEFTLDFAITQEEGVFSTEMTLTQPSQLAGISVKQQGIGGGSQLIWDDLILETGDLNQEGLSPVTALPQLLEQLCSGYIRSTVVEERWTGEGDRKEILILHCGQPDSPVGEGQEGYLWLDKENYSLLGGEILQDGCRVILCEVTNFTLHEG